MNLPAPIVKTWQDLQLNFDALKATIASLTTSLTARIVALETRTAFISAVSFGGPWSAAVPGPTTGTPFAIPRTAIAWIVIGATAFTTGATSITLEVWLDGVNTGRSVTLSFATPTNVHQMLGPCQISTVLAAGTHYVALRQVAGTSDANDYANISVIQP